MGDIDISNGTCYTAAGVKLGSEFIPCGNTAYGYQTCCGKGDNCLADNACFGIYGSNYGGYLTYFAGCTDPNYNDPSCPKKVVDQPWVALTLCDDADAWAICSQSGNPATLQPGSYCSCTVASSATIAFKDARSLANHASLPQSTGGTISYFPGYTPSGTLTANSGGGSGGGGNTGAGSAGGGSSNTGGGGGASTTGGSGSSATGGSSGTSGTRGGSTPTSTGTANSSGTAAAGSSGGDQSSSSSSQPGSTSSSGIGTGAIVGIVIGVIAAILILALIAFLFYRRRKRRQAMLGPDPQLRNSKLSTSPMKPGGLGEYVRPNTPPVPEADSLPVAEVAGQPAKPWLVRSELDSKEVSRPNSALGTASMNGSLHSSFAELPGSNHPRPVAARREDETVAPFMPGGESNVGRS